MHAVIKIISFLIFGAAVALGNLQILLAAFILILPLYLSGSGKTGHALRILIHLRWLFLSILVLYLFFTPGQLLWPGIAWGPTVEGLGQGMSRVAVLVLLVLAVNWMINTTSQGDFLAAILWCMRPVTWVGLSHERLAVRITLTMEKARMMRDAYVNRKLFKPSPSNSQGRLAVIAGFAQHLVDDVVSEASSNEALEISLPEQGTPPAKQWLIPAILAVLFLGLNYYASEIGLLFS